ETTSHRRRHHHGLRLGPHRLRPLHVRPRGHRVRIRPGHLPDHRPHGRPREPHCRPQAHQTRVLLRNPPGRPHTHRRHTLPRRLRPLRDRRPHPPALVPPPQAAPRPTPLAHPLPLRRTPQRALRRRHRRRDDG